MPPHFFLPVVVVIALTIAAATFLRKPCQKWMESTFSRPLQKNHPHPRHEVTNDKSKYRCSDCKQWGLGKRFKCQQCTEYIVHPNCLDPPRTVRHPFLRGCKFEYYRSGGKNKFCEACGKRTVGFFYECGHCNKVLHTNCARLERKLTTDDKKQLRLKDKMTSECSRCKLKSTEKRRTTWGYVSENGECQLHIYCVMKLVAEKTSNGRCKELIRKFKNGALKRIRRPELWINMAAAIASALLGDPTGLIALVPYILTS